MCSGFKGQAPPRDGLDRGGSPDPKGGRTRWTGEQGDEIVLVIGDESLLTEDLVETLNDVEDDIKLLVGTLTSSLQEEVQATVPAATTFVSGLEWFTTEDDTAIGRILLVDRGSILVSSIMPESKAEQAIFGEGFGNGLVVIARRLMAEGLVPVRDPSH